MSERNTYEPLPANIPKLPHVLEREQSHLLTEAKETSSHAPRKSRHLLRHWRWEICTFSLGTGAFVSILVLLLRFRDKPLPTLPFGGVSIQLTAVLAALAQVAQSALLVPISVCIGQLKWEWFQHSKRVIDLDRFDSASRGPEGSIKLLFYLARRPRLVSLGALATILMLGFSTFVQQSVQIGEKPNVETHSTFATIPRAVNVFETDEATAMVPTPTADGTILWHETDTGSRLSYILETGMSDYLSRHLLGNSIYGSSVSNVYGRCDSYGYKSSDCSWPAFNTMALCYSTSNISDQIIRNGDHVTLPSLQAFLPKGQDPPSFQSGTHAYLAQNRSAAISAPPATSVSNGTSLPNLAEIYYLYYDACKDGPSAFNKSDPTRWQALKGHLQFCINRLDSTTSGPSLYSDTKLLSSTADLNWYTTNKANSGRTLCTKIEGENDEFCVAESFMESLSKQISGIFNTTAYFSDTNLSDIKYSTALGKTLAKTVFGCTTTATRQENKRVSQSTTPRDTSRRSWGGPHEEITGQIGFDRLLAEISQTLSDE
ncbi:hypothetical protein P280DRAFT_473857, partial [Massarina eburnea CBS 473.64]